MAGALLQDSFLDMKQAELENYCSLGFGVGRQESRSLLPVTDQQRYGGYGRVFAFSTEGELQKQSETRRTSDTCYSALAAIGRWSNDGQQSGS